jgi:hypothetical protein
MNGHQKIALREHCRLSLECVHPEFSYVPRPGIVSIVLTVNSGYE